MKISRIIFFALLFSIGFVAKAQTISGIEADTKIQKLLAQSQGDKESVFLTVNDLVGCSGYFGAFYAYELRTDPNNVSALQGLKQMEKDTSMVAALLWSKYSVEPGSEVQYIYKKSLSIERQKIELNGVNNIGFLQQYDQCSQTFLFSQFMMSMTKDLLNGTGAGNN